MQIDQSLDNLSEPVLRAQTYLTVASNVAERLLRSARTEEHAMQRDDLLRSMLVFACAGMDRSCKALVEDALPALAMMDTTVEEFMEKFATRFVSVGNELRPDAIARLLLDPYSPREALIRAMVEDLTGDSLQSVDQLFKIWSALRLPNAYLTHNRDALREAFRARNAIVHEMDIVRGGTDTKKRHVDRASRTEETYVTMANAALAVASELISNTAQAIRERKNADPFWRGLDFKG